jgi:uncharacterized membrane protein
MNPLFGEKNLHRAFELGLLFKAFFALLEVAGGFVAFFISERFLLGLILRLTQQQLARHPDNVIANFLIHSAENFSLSTRHFLGIYLLTHGVVKLALIIALWRQKTWSYPAAMIVFALFILYQLYRFSFTHSPWLLILTLLDLSVLWLTWHEYAYLRRLRSTSSAIVENPKS